MHLHSYICLETYAFVVSVAYVWFIAVGGFVRVSVVTRYLG